MLSQRGHDHAFRGAVALEVGGLAAVHAASTALLAAAMRGYEPLLLEIEQLFASILGARRAAVLLRSDAWRPRDDLRADRAALSGPDVPRGVDLDAAAPSFCGDALLVPVRCGAVSVLVEGAAPSDEVVALSAAIARAAELALAVAEGRRLAAENLDEVEVMQDLAARILRSHDLEEILFAITHEAKRLLGADICGVMLREGDEIVMRRCVGHRAPETASLRMRAGQGVAGRVFATLEPYHVEDYLKCTAITSDFFALARAERVRSAFAAPLLAQRNISGVLEVWRRRPSTFTVQDGRRLMALANLASIAIDNARLYTTLERTVTELETANARLDAECAVIHASNAFQHELVRLLLEERSLAALIERAATHVQGPVVVFDEALDVAACAPRDGADLDDLREVVARRVRESAGKASDTLQCEHKGTTVLIHAVAAGVERFGWVAFAAAGEPHEGRALALRQVAVATALYYAERRAASLARAETLDALTWDLLEGADEARRAALSRARAMRVPIDRPLRVALCALESTFPQGADPDSGRAGRHLRQLDRAADLGHVQVLATGARGDRLAVLLDGVGVDEADRFGQRLVARLARENGGSPAVGLSTVCSDPLALPAAYREARIALDVACLRAPIRVAAYEQIGMVGLLLSLREQADLSRIIETVLGGLASADDAVHEPLLETLRTFFDTNCSQAATAQCLGIHPKTVSHRLGRLSELTGLDLSRHEDRLLADVALRLRELRRGPTVRR
jgi:sugar diacid utilization regulator/putative methionine-R-sulfoxide reductase with GAF domain